jgi:predicted metal-dependent hydrolase
MCQANRIASCQGWHSYLKSEAEQTLTPQVIALSEQLGKRRVVHPLPRSARPMGLLLLSKRMVTLSWRVMMASPQAQHYLVAHEVAHLVEMNHSRGSGRWWQASIRIGRSGQRALKSAEKQLMAIRFS